MDQDPERGWASPSEEPPASSGSDRPDLRKGGGEGDQPAFPQYAPPPGATGQPQYGQPQYSQPQYGQPQYGQPQYGQPQYGQPQYSQPQYSQPPPGYAPPGAGLPHYAPPGGNQWGPSLADKPGVIPLRPLAVGEILDGTFATIRANFKATVGLSFLVVLIGQLVVLALTLAVRNSDVGARVVGLLTATVVTQLISTIATGAMIIVVGEAVLGTKISASEAFGRLQGRVWRLFGLGLLVALFTVLGLVLVFVGAIWVAVLLSLAAPVFVLEKTSVGDALRRSRALVTGSWWRTLGIGFLGYLVGGIIGGLVQLPFSYASGSTNALFDTNDYDSISAGSEVWLTIGRIVGGTISTPIIAGTIALIYVDRRIRREGLDLSLAEAARERAGRS